MILGRRRADPDSPRPRTSLPRGSGSGPAGPLAWPAGTMSTGHHGRPGRRRPDRWTLRTSRRRWCFPPHPWERGHGWPGCTRDVRTAWSWWAKVGELSASTGHSPARSVGTVGRPWPLCGRPSLPRSARGQSRGVRSRWAPSSDQIPLPAQTALIDRGVAGGRVDGDHAVSGLEGVRIIYPAVLVPVVLGGDGLELAVVFALMFLGEIHENFVPVALSDIPPELRQNQLPVGLEEDIGGGHRPPRSTFSKPAPNDVLPAQVDEGLSVRL